MQQQPAQPQSAADLEYHIAKLRLQPGDLLVVKIDHTISAEICGRIRDHFEAALKASGISNRVLVVDNSIELSVLARDEIEKRV